MEAKGPVPTSLLKPAWHKNHAGHVRVLGTAETTVFVVRVFSLISRDTCVTSLYFCFPGRRPIAESQGNYNTRTSTAVHSSSNTGCSLPPTVTPSK
jgi:hypothetical protein